MEQAYRKLIKKLSEHELVESVSGSYYDIKVCWKSGIKERIVLQRRENNAFKRLRYLKSPKYRPHFAPRAVWWEDLSNGYEVVPNYFEGINEFEHNLDDHPGFINWKWSEIERMGFYERLILMHRILQFFIDNGWKKLIYPQQSLADDVNLILSDDLTKYKLKKIDFYCLRRHKQRPGEKIIKHFMPYGHFGYNNPSHLLKCETFRDIKRIHSALRLLFNRNLKNPKKKSDINYNTVLGVIKNPTLHKQAKLYIPRQIGLYRRIIKDLELSGRSFYDVEPFLGERSLAAYAEGCPYHFKPSCPFDENSKALGKFLGCEFYEDSDDRRYDFSIYDNENYDLDTLLHVHKLMSEKVDTGLIYIQNMYYDDFRAHHEPDEVRHMKTSRSFQYCGRWMIFNF